MGRFEGLDPHAARRAKLAAWRELGVDPYPATTPAHQRTAEVRASLEGLQPEQDGGRVAVAGRLRALRGQGAILFADLQDQTGRIQVVFQQDQLSSAFFERLELIDLGDFIWVEGVGTRTKRGELSVRASQWQLLSKALEPLPDSWSGLQDVEARQRQRYLDLLVNPGVKERFEKRAILIDTMRSFLKERGFLEVETNTLEHIPGGADAEPFVTHHNALDEDFYLRISLELPLKRLVAGGIDRVFEIGRVYRNEGMSPQHLQEFTELEWYWAYANYQDGMQLTEELYRHLAQAVTGSLQVARPDGVTLDFAAPFARRSYLELVKEHTGVDLLEVSDEALVEELRKRGITANATLGRGRLYDLFYKKTVRPHLLQPTFVLDVPTVFSPLAKQKSDDPRLTERFLLVVDGAEVGNAFSELNDPEEQARRFAEQEALRLAGDPEAQRTDVDFLRAMSHGMPPMCGFGAGIDRLLQLFLGLSSIRETVLFPLMRPERE